MSHGCYMDTCFILRFLDPLETNTSRLWSKTTLNVSKATTCFFLFLDPWWSFDNKLAMLMLLLFSNAKERRKKNPCLSATIDRSPVRPIRKGNRLEWRGPGPGADCSTELIYSWRTMMAAWVSADGEALAAPSHTHLTSTR